MSTALQMPSPTGDSSGPTVSYVQFVNRYSDALSRTDEVIQGEVRSSCAVARHQGEKPQSNELAMRINFTAYDKQQPLCTSARTVLSGATWMECIYSALKLHWNPVRAFVQDIFCLHPLFANILCEHQFQTCVFESALSFWTRKIDSGTYSGFKFRTDVFQRNESVQKRNAAHEVNFLFSAHQCVRTYSLKAVHINCICCVHMVRFIQWWASIDLAVFDGHGTCALHS